MSAKGRKRTQTWGATLGVIACACFVLQQFLVPLHLALHDHFAPYEDVETAVSAAFGGGHGHAHPHGHGHGHAHEHGERNDGAESDDHHPHPVEDHLAQLAPAVVTTLVHVAVAMPPAQTGLPSHELAAGVRPAEEEHGGAPPLLRTAAPRAPPIAA